MCDRCSNGDEMSSFEEMKKLNSNFSIADYIYYVATKSEAPSDCFIALFELLSPATETVDGRVLVTSIGAVQKYREHRNSGKTCQEAQYWANLLELTGLFGIDDPAGVQKIAKLFAICWREAIAQHDLAPPQLPIIIQDTREGELFITISSQTDKECCSIY